MYYFCVVAEVHLCSGLPFFVGEVHCFLLIYCACHQLQFLICSSVLLIYMPMIFLILFCSVFTPYYSEIVLYSLAELQKRNEDGITTLFYLQKIYPGPIFPFIVKDLISAWNLDRLF
jgi:hypothetical protein